MRRFLVLLSSVLFVAAPLQAQRRAGGPPAPGGDVGGEVRSTFAAYSRALNAADWTRVITFYADDPRFEWVEDGEVRYPSKDALAQSFDAMRETGSTIVFKTEPPHVAVLGPGVAALRASFETTIVDKEGKPFTFGGLLTIDVIKTAEGWKFLRGHTSSANGGR
ncbi:MAG: nuclear transport factor 2 family protein [Gemmatimonadetes bacterium]|nr:nuclear transport factor 2 family protein [Gemmatimonadota bacterium]